MKKIRRRVKRYEIGARNAGGPNGRRQTPVAYEFAGFRLEPARRALIRPDGTPARLSGKPFDTLVYLVERAGELVDRDELLRSVWPKRVIEDNNLNQAIATLRRVLGQQTVVTVAGRGYQFVTPVRRVERPPRMLRPTTERRHASRRRTSARLTVPPPSPVAYHRACGGQCSSQPPLRRVALVIVLALDRERSPPTSLEAASVTVQPLTAYPR